jgi:hypothetical protein
MPRKPKPQDGPLPAGKGRSEVFDKLHAPLEGLDGKDYLKAAAQVMTAMRYHPDTRAQQIIERHLTAAHLDPALAESPELSSFVLLMRNLLAEHVPGMTLEQMLEPLHTLLARRDGRGGGRPPSEHEHADMWRRLVDEKQLAHARMSMSRVCDLVARDWNTNYKEAVTGDAIRNALKRSG